MFCRRAWQRVGPLAQNLLRPTFRTPAPVRRMALGLPAGSTNMNYLVLCGGGLTAAVAAYAYKTVSGDSERHEEKITDEGSTKDPLPDVPAPVEETTIEAVAESAQEEPVAETSAEPVSEGTDEAEVKEVAVTEEDAPPEAEIAPAEVDVQTAEGEVTPADQQPTADPETESFADGVTAVQLLAASSVKRAAASVEQQRSAEDLHQNEDMSLHTNASEAEVIQATVEVPVQGACEEDEMVSAGEEELNPTGVTPADAPGHEMDLCEEKVRVASLLSALSDGVLPDVTAMAEEMLHTSEVVSEGTTEEVPAEAPAVQAMQEIVAEGLALAGDTMAETSEEAPAAGTCESAEVPAENEEVPVTMVEEEATVACDGLNTDEAAPEAPPQETSDESETSADEAAPAEDEQVPITQVSNDDTKVTVEEANEDEVKEQEDGRISPAEEPGQESPADVLTEDEVQSTEVQVVPETEGLDLEVPDSSVSGAPTAVEGVEEIEDNDVTVDVQVAVMA